MKTVFFTVAGYVAVFALVGGVLGAGAVYLYEKGKSRHVKKLAKANKK